MASPRRPCQRVVSAVALLVVAAACNGRGDVPRRLCPRHPEPDPTLSLRSWEEVAGTADEAWAIGTRGSTPGDYQVDVLLHWDGCDWQVAPSPLDDKRLDRLSALSTNGRDVWLAGNQTMYIEAMEVFNLDGTIHRSGRGRVTCRDDARMFRRVSDGWEEVGSATRDGGVAVPGREGTREDGAVAAVDPTEVWTVDRRCGDASAPDAALRRWNSRGSTTVEVDRAIGPPIRLLVQESRAWPWSNPVKMLFLLGAKGSGRLLNDAWSWSPFAGKDTPWLLAGGQASDLWAFGEGAQRWDGARWAVVRAPGVRALNGTPPVVFMWAGAAAGGRTFALDSQGSVFRTDGARIDSIGRVHGRVVALAAGADELWLWGIESFGPPALRWRAGRWELSPSAKGANVFLESPTPR